MFFCFGMTTASINWFAAPHGHADRSPQRVLGRNCEKSRVRNEHPDLSADLGPAAGELIATLWTRATASAGAALDALRGEGHAPGAAAQLSVAATRDEVGRVETALEQRTAALLATRVQVRELKNAEVERHVQWPALEADLDRMTAARAARDWGLVEDREGSSRDLEKQREAAERAENRLRASEKRALLEIDRERRAAGKLQKELDEVKGSGANRKAG